MTAIPSKGWDSYHSAFKAVGERRSTTTIPEAAFLQKLGLVSSDDPTQLTTEGEAYFAAAFIRQEEAAAMHILRTLLMRMPPVIAIAQMLDGVATASRSSVEVVLRNQGFGAELKDRDVGFLVALLARAGVIRYNKGSGAVEVLVHIAAEETVPPSAFISPAAPFGNRIWLRRILEEGHGHLRWLDKHFTSPALEVLWEAVDGHRVSEVSILSLYMEDYHSGRKVRRDYGNLKAELANRGVSLEWRVIDSKLVRDTHDRWVLTDSSARNIPNVNAIFSGQHSELNVSSQRDELASLFDGYWAVAVDIELVWEEQRRGATG